MNTGMKYPAGMGMVVARISIQNWWGTGGTEVRGNWTRVGKREKGQGTGELPREKAFAQAHAPRQHLLLAGH